MKAWNLLGGLEWAGLDVTVEMLGIRDVEKLVADLTVIREFQGPEQ